MLCRIAKNPCFFRTRMPISHSQGRRSYAYEEDRLRVLADLEQELQRFSQPQQTKLREKYNKFACSFEELTVERQIEVLHLLRKAFEERSKQPWSFQHPPQPPPGVEPRGFIPNPTEEDEQKWLELIEGVLEPVVPLREQPGTDVPLPKDWDTLTPDDVRTALNDPDFINTLQKETNIGGPLLDELLSRLEKIEKFQNTPEAEEMTLELMHALGIKPGQTIEEISELDIEPEEVWKKMQTKMTEAEKLEMERENLRAELEESAAQQSFQKDAERLNSTAQAKKPSFNPEELEKQFQKAFDEAGIAKLDDYWKPDGTFDKEKMKEGVKQFESTITPEKDQAMNVILADMMSSGSFDGLVESVQKHGGVEAIFKKVGIDKTNPLTAVFDEAWDARSSADQKPWENKAKE